MQASTSVDGSGVFWIFVTDTWAKALIAPWLLESGGPGGVNGPMVISGMHELGTSESAVFSVYRQAPHNQSERGSRRQNAVKFASL